MFPHLRNVYLILNICRQTSIILTIVSFCHCNVNVTTSEDVIEQTNPHMIKRVELLLNNHQIGDKDHRTLAFQSKGTYNWL